MIGAGLHAQLVAFGPGIPDVAIGAHALMHFGFALLPGARGAGGLVVRFETLVDLDQRFEGGIVIAPVGSLLGGGGVRRGDAIGLAQVGIENRPTASGALGFGLADAQHRLAALSPDHVAMAVGIPDAALVSLERDEPARHVVTVFRFP